MDTTTHTAPSTLRELAVLINLSMRGYSPRVLDRKESKKYTDNHNAAAGSAKVQRDILIGTHAAEVLADITKLQGEARKLWRERTLPWDDDGRRMCSNEIAHDLFIELRGFESRLKDLANKFADAWANAGPEAQKSLNGLWNADDYIATPDTMRRRFGVAIEIEQLPRIDDLRINAPDAVLAEIREQAERNITARFTAGCKDAYKRLYQAIAKMHEKLADPEAQFKDSLVGNLRELVDILPALNLANDPTLKKMTDDARKRLLSFDIPAQLACLKPEGASVKALATALRDQPRHRQETANAAAAILADMRNYLGGAPE